MNFITRLVTTAAILPMTIAPVQAAHMGTAGATLGKCEGNGWIHYTSRGDVMILGRDGSAAMSDGDGQDVFGKWHSHGNGSSEVTVRMTSVNGQPMSFDVIPVCYHNNQLWN